MTSKSLIIRLIGQTRTSRIKLSLNRLLNTQVPHRRRQLEPWRPLISIDRRVHTVSIEIPTVGLIIEAYIVILDRHGYKGKHFHHFSTHNLDKLSERVISNRQFQHARFSTIRNNHLITRGRHVVSLRVINSFHQRVRFESEDRFDLGRSREINRVEVIHRDVKCVLTTIHHFEQGITRIQHCNDRFDVICTTWYRNLLR